MNSRLIRSKHLFRSPRYPNHYASSPDMFILLGHAGESKWPDAGVPATTVQGIRVWVLPIVRREDGRKSSKHRVRCECPACGVELSAGRLHQHACRPADVLRLADRRDAEIMARRTEGYNPVRGHVRPAQHEYRTGALAPQEVTRG